MTAENLFSIANPVALIGWLILVAGIALNNPLLRDRIAGLYIPLGLAVTYTALIAVFWWRAPGGFDSLPNVQRLFTSPWIALAGWVHYLAYDLFIAALLARRIMERKLSRLFLVPILPLAFLFGPAGFLFAHILLINRKEIAS
jgi:hypothetical protein